MRHAAFILHFSLFIAAIGGLSLRFSTFQLAASAAILFYDLFSSQNYVILNHLF